MKKPVFRLRNMQRSHDGKIYAALCQEDTNPNCGCPLPAGSRTWKVIAEGPIERVLEHAMAQGFVIENVKIEPVAPNAVAPEDHPEDKLNA